MYAGFKKSASGSCYLFQNLHSHKEGQSRIPPCTRCPQRKKLPENFQGRYSPHLNKIPRDGVRPIELGQQYGGHDIQEGMMTAVGGQLMVGGSVDLTKTLKESGLIIPPETSQQVCTWRYIWPKLLALAHEYYIPVSVCLSAAEVLIFCLPTKLNSMRPKREKKYGPSGS